ncbi:hypothetical protein SAMN05421823_103141 [Catalinimonas alkaloidigena]|uniref:Uncharacterized protein n=1 Tax=Catalinimonas alkaloidigena TaxID=1075417 RepID=A0A1G9DIH6_9BACT|nr:hypothetical protein [Catalinimonas alkaloidigena]SDK63620.1 hypothetical protein SAMN05421823_103141 [Catalinimonas alkaloidigena]
MKNLGFNVYLNGKLISTNGINADGVVTQIVTLRTDVENDEQSLELYSGGYLSKEDAHYK